ncbi:MAG: OmpA family protein [Acidimicrobiales bacterium]|nr:OmpA family protein [Acidimicrobiales bacterium]
MRAIQRIAGVAAFAIALAVLAYLADNLRTETFQSVATVTIDDELPDLARQEILGTAFDTVDDPDFAEQIDESEGLAGTLDDLRAEQANGGLRIVAEAKTRQAARSAAQAAAEAIVLERSRARAAELEPTLTTLENEITELDRILADRTTADATREESELARADLLLERNAAVAALEQDELEITNIDSSESPIRPRPGRTALLVGLVAAVLGLLVIGRRARTANTEAPEDRTTPSTDVVQSPPSQSPTNKKSANQSRSREALPRKATMAKKPKGKRTVPSVLDDPEATIVPPKIPDAPNDASAPKAPAESAPPKTDPPVSAETAAKEALPAMPMESAGPKLSQRLSDTIDPTNVRPLNTGTARFGRNGDVTVTTGPPAVIQARAKEAEAAKPTPKRPPVSAGLPATGGGRSDGRLDVVSYHVAGLDEATILLFTDLDDVEQGHEGAARLTEDLVRRGFGAAHLKLVGSSDATTIERSRQWLEGDVETDLKPSGTSDVEQLEVELERHRAADIAKAIAVLAENVDKVIVSSNSVGGRSAQLELARLTDGVVIQAESQADTTDAANDFERIEIPHVATLRLTPQRRGLPLWVAAAGLIALLGAGALAGFLALRDDGGTNAQTAPDAAGAIETVPSPGPSTVAPPASIAEPTAPGQTPPTLPPTGTAGTVPVDPGPAPVDPGPVDPGPAEPAPPVGVPTPDLVFNLPADLPEVEAARRHRGVYNNGVLFLEGEVASAEEGAEFESRAIAILGAENVVNNYIVNPDAPESTDGRIIIADPFLFGSGSSSLANADQELLGLGTLVLQQFPDVVFRVSAHTDNIGDPEDNLALSQRRGEAFVRFYVQQGFDASRFEVVAKGETEPVATNTTLEGRARNRRLEVELLGLLGSE